MSSWTESDYKAACTKAGVSALYTKYWGTWGDWDTTVAEAWKVYRALTKEAGGLWLDVQLLGDTKIRLDPALLMNFGATGATGLQGRAEKDAIIEAAALRWAATHSGSGPTAAELADVVAQAEKNGNILSERSWSTLANDSFMVTGFHQLKDFHFVGEFPETAGSQTEVTFADFRANGGASSGTKFKRDLFEFLSSGKAKNVEEASAMAQWKAFFLRYPQILWNSDANVPRVFARELLGLKLFGYKPFFHELGLFFSPATPQLATGATFEAYARHLEDAASGPFHGGSRSMLLAGLTRYLFGTAIPM